MDTQGKFYLGRHFDIGQGTTTGEPFLYDPGDLTTHAVVVGMTGSGKTGLCINLLEEAALNGIPALMIDPKGDITNTLLHFPGLSTQDFLPWVNADQARRAGQTVEQAAADAAARWREGLAEWEIGQERLERLGQACDFAVYTPGSDMGLPVSILTSLKAPPIPWEGNREILREKISATATALLGLVGVTDIDPVRSREHILLANIFEHAWSQGRDLDLGELILQTQSPPFPKLGVFDVNTFFPEKDRFTLAMQLNNILAAPSFQAWIEGQALDISSLLYTREGRPRHCVFYIAHLNDAERMFFVTLLFSAVEAWMRSQAGTASLRAIVYFDEIFGYLPPISNPPSKLPMLRMLKQARAFGVGLLLVTQNPVDVDYKALSNAGTWFIGKLQTEQDKARLLDGLESAAAGGLNRQEYDRLISALGKRVFLLHNVHAPHPRLFQTRWVMNFLAGPLTRSQIPTLNHLAGPQAATGSVAPEVDEAPYLPVRAEPSASYTQPGLSTPSFATTVPQAPSMEPSPTGSTTRPSILAGVREYTLPNNLTFTQAFEAAGQPYPEEAYSLGMLYRPAILAQANSRFFNRKYNLDYELQQAALVLNPDRRGAIRWENFIIEPVEAAGLEAAVEPQARYAGIEMPFTDGRLMAGLSKDYLDWAYRYGVALVRANEALKLYAGPEVSAAEFRKLSAEAARQARDAEIKKVADSYEKKMDAIRLRLTREERELSEDQTELSQRRMEELGTHAENVFSLFGKSSRRRLSTSLSKRRMTEQAKADVQESVEAIAEMKRQLAGLEKEKESALQEVSQRWGEAANQIREISVPAMKKDMLLDLFGVAWFPFHLVQVGQQVIELPGYSAR